MRTGRSPTAAGRLRHPVRGAQRSSTIDSALRRASWAAAACVALPARVSLSLAFVSRLVATPVPVLPTSDPARPDPTAETDAQGRFIALLRHSLSEGTLKRLVLAKPRRESDLRRVVVRALQLQGRAALSFVYSHTTRDITRNLSEAEGLAAVERLLADVVQHAHLLTTTEDVQLLRSKRGRTTLIRATASAVSAPATTQAPPVVATAASPESAPGRPAASAAPAAVPIPAPHDRAKRRYIDIGRPWLVALGITDAQHRLIPALARKWKQINKFVEIFDHALADAPLDAAGPLRVVDFGCGKGYLTFGLHDHLQTLGRRVDVIGVELREDLVQLCNDAVRRSALEGLTFVHGDIRSHAVPGLDVMIALHACDTATDHAIHAGIAAGASIIMCSPCCHKQLRPQLRIPEAQRPLLRHGIHLGQQAEMLTDALRALLLEANGYTARVFEFVSLEHTSKNKMILAVKRMAPGADPATARAEVRALKDYYGIREHCLETLLDADADADSAHADAHAVAAGDADADADGR